MTMAVEPTADALTPPGPPVIWTTPVGLRVTRRSTPVPAGPARADLETALDRRRGLLLSSRSDQPGRYRHGDLGYVDPPIEIVGRGRALAVRALNDRGAVLLPALTAALDRDPEVRSWLVGSAAGQLALQIPAPAGPWSEEDRTRRPSVFTVLRVLLRALAGPDPLLGLYGAFGYDLVLQFEPIPLHQPRDPADRDLVLHLPDAVLQVDAAGRAVRHCYEFELAGRSTAGLSRRTADTAAGTAVPGTAVPGTATTGSDHAPGEYAALVETARRRFRSGDLFEVVPGRAVRRPCDQSPATVFRRLRRDNPAPYGLLANLGDGEHLIGASPEMFVRVGRADDGWWVESCPISGTVARGRDALEDARQVQALLGSRKEESELTMCTDVDRNDKARVCDPATITVLGRRMIETYATLIHTVDHVRGRLLPGRDALDGFLSHAWAVTVTGAPKRAAIQFIEEHERSPRRWYGGAVGRFGTDGTAETALTLRTVHLRDGVATVRAGATLLYDSDPAAEEAETLLKARALLAALAGTPTPARVAVPRRVDTGATRTPRVLLVDHQDSFVHMLAGYLRQAGARVSTHRAGFDAGLLDELCPDLVVLSPGPGRPADFDVSGSVRAALDRDLAVFGVCLGLQGIVEHFGGRLAVLDVPVHGKPSVVRPVDGGGAVFAGLPPSFEVGRYHSLHADRQTLPAALTVTAETADGVVMGLEHVALAVSGVQFHPESILTQGGRCGHAIVANVLAGAVRRSLRRAA